MRERVSFTAYICFVGPWVGAVTPMVYSVSDYFSAAEIWPAFWYDWHFDSQKYDCFRQTKRATK